MGDRGARVVVGLLGVAVLAGCAGSSPQSARSKRAPDVISVATAGRYEGVRTVSAPSKPTQSIRSVGPDPVPVDLPAGVHEQDLEVDGQVRHWTTVVPATPGGSRPPALVVVLHGVGGHGVEMRLKGFEPLAATQGAVMAYPDAFGGAWNDGRPATDPVVPGVTVDDVGFLRLLIDRTTAVTGTDPRRVTVVGLSNGAMMAARVACDLADRVSAVALVVGSGGQGFEQTCRPARPVAMMVAAGSDDTTVPYAGGRVADWAGKQRGYVAGVEEFFDFWRAQNGCTSTQVLVPSVAVREARGADCRSGNAVVRYRVEGGVHEWYEKPKFDTTNAIWEFVVRYFPTTA